MINFFIKPKQLFWDFTQYLLACLRQVNIAGRTLQISAVFLLLICSAGSVWAQTTNYCNPAVTAASTINSNVWSTTLGGPYTSAINVTGGAVLVFQGGAITGAANADVISMMFNTATTWTAGGTISNGSTGAPVVEITVATGVTQTLPQVFAGTTALTKKGVGTLTLSGINSNTGNTTVQAGILNVSSIGNTGVNSNIGAGTAVILAGGTLRYTGATATVTKAFNFAAGTTSTILINIAANTLTASSNIPASTGGFIKDGAGTLLLSGANAYTGPTTVNVGVLRAGSTTAFGNCSAVTLADVSGVDLQLNDLNVSIGSLAGGGTNSTGVTLGTGNLTVGCDNTNTTYAGSIGGSGGLTKTGTGTLTLSGVNTYTGATNINQGVVSIALATSLGATPGTAAPANVVFDGGTLQITANMTFPANKGITVNAGGGTIEVTGTAAVTSGLLAGAGTFTKTGTGTLTYPLSNFSLTTPMVINEGVYSTNSIARVANSATNWVMGGGTYRYTGIADFSTPKFFTLTNGTSSTIDIVNSIVLTISGASPSSTGGLNKAGAGTLVLLGTNLYTGTTTISAGTLTLGAAGVIHNSSNINMAGGTFNTANFSETVGTLSVSAASNITMGASNTLTFSGVGTISNNLAITGYTAGASKIFIGTSNVLSANDLSKITINGLPTCHLNTGELVLAATIGISGGATSVNYPTVSSVTFTQTGTPGGIWSVTPTTYGSINASTGAFTATGYGPIDVAYSSPNGCASSRTFNIGSDTWTTSAPNILNNSLNQCLTGATKETGCTTGSFMENQGAGTNFADNFLNHCSSQNAGCTGAAATQFNKTDFNDFWYKVVLPTGTTEMTLTAGGITGADHIAFGLYTAQPINDNGHNAVTNANISNNAGKGGAFFNSTQTSHRITNLTAGGTYYIRVMGALANNGSADICTSIPKPCFTISATAPQENDVCNNAINITTNNGGAAHTGNYAASTSESSDEWNSCPVSAGAVTAAGDLWYSVNYPDFPSVVQNFYTELTLNGTAGQQVRVVVYSTITGCSSTAGNVAYCEVVTLTGANFTTNLGNLLSTDGFSRRVQIIPIGTVGSVTASAAIVFQNNSCSQFNNALPGFDLDNGSFPLDMNYATASGVGGIAGKDMWYQVSTGNKQNITFTIADDDNWAGTLSLMLYEYPSFLSLDCNNLTLFCQETGVTEFALISGKTFNLANGNYLLRVVETTNTAGALNVTLTGTTSTTVILPNSTCSTSVPDITNGSQTGNLTQAQLPCPNTSITGCNGLPINATPSDPHYGAKLYYKFTMPNDLCPSLAASTRRTSATISFSGLATASGAGTKNVYVQLYQACGGTPIDCGQANNGAPITFNNLVGGTTYYAEIINNTLSSTGTANFTIQQVTFPNPVPCNDAPANAQALEALPNCPSSSSLTSTSYTALPTYSAQGATPEVGGSSDKTVWFKFTAPSPANGGVYSGLSARSWVTVFLEGQSAHNIEMELYLTGGTTIATGQTTTYSVNGVGDRTWGKFGNLDPGVEYWVRLKHNQIPAVNVLYKIDIWAGGMQNDFEPLACGANTVTDGAAAQLCGSCGDLSYDAASGQVPSSYNSNTLIDQSLCEEYYKIDLPLVNAHTTKYWVVEVRGFKQMLDFELRKQVITETINPGGADYDHPCWSRPLADEEFISSDQKGYNYDANQGPPYFLVDGSYLEAGSCNDLGGVAPHSGGFRKVYKGLSGGVDIPLTKNYYFLRVFMNPNDPQAATCEQNGGIQACQVIFKGPYNSQAAAEAGGAPDGGTCGTIVANTTNAANDFNHTLINTPVSGTVALNDYDLEGDTQTYITTPVTLPAHGSVTLNANGTYTYTPTTGYTGQDSFVYQVCDNGTPQACDNATVYIEILANPTTANEPPIANPDHYLTEINTPVSGSIISNDSDPDGNPITINTTPITNPTSGSVTINTNGTYTYTPNTGFTGTDSFVYQICDNGTPPLCDQATVTIDVIPNNGNIIFAGDDSGIGLMNTTITGNVLANDFDAEGNTITLNTTPLTNPSNGTVTLLPNGTFSYIPTTGFVGNDAFTYQICDNGTPQACDVATVHLTVLPAYAIAGTLFNDPNGLSNSLVDGIGIGTTSGTQMYANLVLSGSVIQSVTLPGTGIYNFSGLSAGSYTVVIATSATATTPSAASGWVNVGEAFGTNNGAGTGNEGGTPNGSLAVTVGSSNVTGVNFGIEQPPVAGIATSVSQTNPGGTTSVQVDNLLTSGGAAIFSASDPDGTVSSITITTFPSNATSITINGTNYTSGTFPVAGVNVLTNASGVPTQTISVDPVDGNVSVAIAYTTTDAAGQVSNTGTATVPFAMAVTYTLSGNVFDDADGLLDSPIPLVDGIGIGNPSSIQLYANVVNGVNVVATATVNTATGAYSVSGLVAGSYTIQISTNQGTVGNAAPAIALPTAWVNVGEAIGTNNDIGTPDGVIAVTVGSSNVTGVNFGIDSRPTAVNNVAASQANPGGTVQVTVSSTVFSGADAGDLSNTGLVVSIQVQYPTNATSITINGVNYTAATFATAFPLGYTTVPTNLSGNPTQPITVDPSFTGAGSVVFTYYTVDNAGVVSASATATVPFLGAGCSPNAGMWID